MIEIPIPDDSHSVSHAETLSPEYNLQILNNKLIGSTIAETQEIVNNMVNKFSFTKVPSPDPSPFTSPDDKLQVSSYNSLTFPVSEHIANCRQYLKTSYFFIIWKKKQIL